MRLISPMRPISPIIKNPKIYEKILICSIMSDGLERQSRRRNVDDWQPI